MIVPIKIHICTRHRAVYINGEWLYMYKQPFWEIYCKYSTTLTKCPKCDGKQKDTTPSKAN